MPLGECWIGAAGYSYPDWVGPVYPEGTPSTAYLAYYARYFPFVELNFTYYAMPTQERIAGIQAKAPSLHFAVKAFRAITHRRPATDAEFLAYRQALQPLIDTDRLRAVLLQFPHSFHDSPAARRWVEHCRASLPDLPLVAEFRSREWVNPNIPPWLRSMQIGWCAVDEPELPGLMPPLAAVTSPVSYLRFHGRNAAQWYDHEHGWQRYDYRYTEAQLEFWIPKIRRLMEESETTIIVLNNHYRGQGVENGQMLIDLLPPDMLARTHRTEPPAPRVNSQPWRALG